MKIDKSINFVNRAKQIQKLQSQISKLEQDEIRENQKGILPFLQKESVVFRYNGSPWGVEIDLPPEKNSELYDIMAGKQGQWGYHMGVFIDKKVTARYDDGRFSLDFNIEREGENEEEKEKNTSEQFIRIVKKLKIKVSFENEKERLRGEIEKIQSKLNNTIRLEKALG